MTNPIPIEELQLHDWVIVGTTACIVRAIHNYDEFDVSHTMDDAIAWDCINSQDPFPILLTSEILEVNGFTGYAEICKKYRKDKHGYAAAYIYSKDNINFEIVGYGELPYRKFFGDIHFVHELQHALRLCGLRELADNFKLEEGGEQ